MDLLAGDDKGDKVSKKVYAAGGLLATVIVSCSCSIDFWQSGYGWREALEIIHWLLMVTLCIVGYIGFTFLWASEKGTR